MKSNRAFAWVLVLGGVAVLGGALAWIKPKFLHGDSKRAATAAKTTEAYVAATDNQGAKAAAVVEKIGEANATAPDSKEKQFIAAAVPLALGYLPGPDNAKLLEMEKLKSAFLSGQLEVAAAISANSMKDAESAKKETLKALTAKRASDDALQMVAAERLGAEKVKDRAIMVAVALGLLYLYTKFTHVGSGALAEAVHDIKTGVPPIQALDGATTRFQQLIVRTINRFKDQPPTA